MLTPSVKEKLSRSHWAYRRENDCVMAQIRRELLENDTPGWTVVASVPEGDSLAHKIMLFHGVCNFHGKARKVLFLEIWWYDNNQRESVEKLYCEMEG